MKIGIFIKRLLGEGVDISYWDKRNRRMLPVLEVDIRQFFDTIDHKHLREFMSRTGASRPNGQNSFGRLDCPLVGHCENLQGAALGFQSRATWLMCGLVGGERTHDHGAVSNDAGSV